MKATNPEEARALFVGAVARLLKGDDFTYDAEAQELRLPDMERKHPGDFGTFQADPYTVVDAFQNEIYDIATRYGGGYIDEEYPNVSGFTDYKPIGALKLEKIVTKALEGAARVNWGMDLPEPDEDLVAEKAELLIEHLSLDPEQANGIARDFLIAQASLSSYGFRFRLDRAEGEGRIFPTPIDPIGLTDEELALINLNGAFAVPANAMGQDVRRVTMDQLVDQLRINGQITYDDNNPYESLISERNSPFGDRYVREAIVAAIHKRASEALDALIVRKHDSAQAFIDSVSSLRPRTISRGEFIATDLVRPPVRGL